MRKYYYAGMLAILVLGVLIFTLNKDKIMAKSNTTIAIPSSLQEEHGEIHKELAAAIASNGETAKAAEEVEKALASHFVSEEEFAMPQLGLLTELSQGKPVANKQEIIEMSDKLKAEMPKMLSEHKTIASAAERLHNVALTENKPEAAAFAEKLILHAKNEEEILYPAAILIGEYLKIT